MTLIGLVCLFASWPATPGGISARFGQDPAVVGQDVRLRVEVTDPIGVVDRVEIALRRGDGPWQRRSAHPAAPNVLSADSVWWSATFTSTTVWPTRNPDRLEARARLLGVRGGVLLVLGDPDPMPIDALTAADFAAQRRVFERARDAESPVGFSGYVGAIGQPGTGARARVFIGFGGRIGAVTEVIGSASLGPAFDRPAPVTGGGPIILGSELAARFYTRALERADWTLFAAPFATVDFRFPGVDAGGGLRAGVAWRLQQELAVELALSGAVMGFGVDAAPQDRAGLGLTGGLRVGLRFGTAAKTAP